MDVFDSTISKATIGDLSYSPTAHISKTVEPHEKGESLEAVSISDDRIKGSEANHLPTPPIEIDEKNARPTSQETRVLLEQVSIETLRTYHIEYHLATVRISKTWSILRLTLVGRGLHSNPKTCP